MSLKEYKEDLKKIKMIVSDIDGTLLDMNLQIDNTALKYSKLIINHGIYFTLASQRIHSSIVPLAIRFDINIPVISLNGALVQDINGNDKLYCASINKKYVNEAVEYAEKNFMKICLCKLDKIIYTDSNSIFKDYFPVPDAEYVKVNDYVNNYNEVLQMNILCENKDVLKKLKKKITFPFRWSIKTNFYRSQSQKNLHRLDIIPSGSSKRKAINLLMKHYGINRKEILVIGDWYNDVELFRIGGFNVTLKNGVRELKEMADYVSDYTNDEDGAGLFLKEFYEIIIN
jgi:Cof subfamily protein (haloacid dehalogenase superfamily)